VADIFSMAAVSIPLQNDGRERDFFPRWIHACTPPFKREAGGGVEYLYDTRDFIYYGLSGWRSYASSGARLLFTHP
jgi:hypothetical protein